MSVELLVGFGVVVLFGVFVWKRKKNADARKGSANRGSGGGGGRGGHNSNQIK